MKKDQRSLATVTTVQENIRFPNSVNVDKKDKSVRRWTNPARESAFNRRLLNAQMNEQMGKQL